MTGIVTVVITDDDKIAAVHKPGNMCFGDDNCGAGKKILLAFDTVQLQQQQQQQPFCKLKLCSVAVSVFEVSLLFLFFFSSRWITPSR